MTCIFSEHDREAGGSSNRQGELHFDGPVQDHQTAGAYRTEEV